MKKAQITIILIIIMILLLIFGLMRYFQSKTTEQQGVQEIQVQRMTIESVKPLQDYLTQCLNIWALRGLELLGKQGGVIYQEQGGLTDEQQKREGTDYLFFPLENAKVAYANRRLTEKENIPVLVSTIAFRPPQYPYLSFPWRQQVKSEEVITGINTLNLLNASTPGAITLKDDLQAFITTQVKNCFDKNAFPTLEIEEFPEKANTTVILTDENMRFFLTYPLKITQTQTGAQMDFANVTVEYPFKLKTFFTFINTAIDQDNTNISFSPRNIEEGNYTISVIENPNPDFPREDLLRFRDNSSLILDKPYVFYVARQNRPPALWLLDQQEFDSQKLCTQCTSGLQGSTMEITAKEHRESVTNATIEIDNTECDTGNPLIDGVTKQIYLIAQDPDEDEVNITLTGAGSFSTTFYVPMPANIFQTLLQSQSIGEHLYTIGIWIDDGTLKSGPPGIAWQEYQEINLTIVQNLCSTP